MARYRCPELDRKCERPVSDLRLGRPVGGRRGGPTGVGVGEEQVDLPTGSRQDLPGLRDQHGVTRPEDLGFREGQYVSGSERSTEALATVVTPGEQIAFVLATS